jgi:hypothetical protein
VSCEGEGRGVIVAILEKEDERRGKLKKEK